MSRPVVLYNHSSVCSAVDGYFVFWAPSWPMLRAMQTAHEVACAHHHRVYLTVCPHREELKNVCRGVCRGRTNGSIQHLSYDVRMISYLKYAVTKHNANRMYGQQDASQQQHSTVQYSESNEYIRRTVIFLYSGIATDEIEIYSEQVVRLL